MRRPTSTDPHYLVQDQYRDATRLDARIELHRRFSTNPRGWHAWVFDQLPGPAQARVLEVGCGTGALWSQNCDRVPTGWHVVLGDLSAGMVGDARRLLDELAGRCLWLALDAQCLPFAAGSFDLVLANHMLYHVADRRRAIRELRRVLRATGTLVAATNGERHLAGLLELAARFAPELGAAAPPATTGFSLENGRQQLLHAFGRVARRDFEDALVVTEAGPLADYLGSMEHCRAIRGRRHELVEFLASELGRHGPIRIEKAAGLFVASGQAPAHVRRRRRRSIGGQPVAERPAGADGADAAP
jgi:SAM-dependent methyltransferase